MQETDFVEAPERRSYFPTSEPTPEDRVTMRILGGNPILRIKYQKWIDEGNDGDEFVQRVLHEPGFEDSLPYDTPGESRPTGTLDPQQKDDFTPEPPAVTLVAGEETPVIAPILEPISDPTPAPTVTAVERFIASSQNGVDGVAVFAGIGGRTPAQPNSFAEASAPRALKPRPTLLDRAIGLLPPGLRPFRIVLTPLDTLIKNLYAGIWHSPTRQNEYSSNNY